MCRGGRIPPGPGRAAGSRRGEHSPGRRGRASSAAPLHVHAESLLGAREIAVTAAGQIVYEAQLPALTGELIIRALQAGQRSFPVPVEEAAAEAAVTDLTVLLKQLDNKLNQLGSTAGVSAQSTLRVRAEGELNLPVAALLAELPPVYDDEL